jgi:hypothetical protein
VGDTTFGAVYLLPSIRRLDVQTEETRGRIDGSPLVASGPTNISVLTLDSKYNILVNLLRAMRFLRQKPSNHPFEHTKSESMSAASSTLPLGFKGST